MRGLITNNSKFFNHNINFLLFLTILLSMLFSCQNEEEPPKTDLVADAASSYVIIQPAKADKHTQKAAEDLQKAILDETGCEIAIKKDNQRVGIDSGDMVKEILIGKTNRPESQEVLAKIQGVGYAVSISESKVVITATHETYITDAVSSFVKNQISGKAENGTLQLMINQEEIKTMTNLFTIAENGVSEYRIIYPSGIDEMTMEIIESTVTNLRNKTGAQIKLYPDWNSSGQKEVIVGITTRQETASESIDYTEYKVAIDGDKILVSSYSREGLQLAFDYLMERIFAVESDNGTSWLLPQDISLDGSIEGWVYGVPHYTSGTFQGLYNCSDNTYEISFGNSRLSEFTAYIQSLEKQDFVKHTKNKIGSNLFYTYKNDKIALHASFYPNTSVCKIIAEPLSYLPATATPAYNKVTASSLTQIGRVDLAVNDNGMSYILQLEDGSFILVDGGNSNLTDAETLYQFLLDNTPGGQNPVIAAWFFSHPHGDHINLPVQFLNMYKDKVTVEMFAFNFADASNVGHAGDVNGPGDYNALVNSVNRVIKNNFSSSTVVKVHTGQKLYLRNAVIEILFTHEDLFPKKFKWVNETSLAFRINVGGSNILLLGDCEIASNNHMAKVYGTELKSDILRPSHHGYNGATLEIYKLIDPSVCLWACSDKAFFKGKVRDFDFNRYLINEANVKAHYTSSYTTTIPLPYTP